MYSIMSKCNSHRTLHNCEKLFYDLRFYCVFPKRIVISCPLSSSTYSTKITVQSQSAIFDLFKCDDYFLVPFIY